MTIVYTKQFIFACTLLVILQTAAAAQTVPAPKSAPAPIAASALFIDTTVTHAAAQTRHATYSTASETRYTKPDLHAAAMRSIRHKHYAHGLHLYLLSMRTMHKPNQRPSDDSINLDSLYFQGVDKRLSLPDSTDSDNGSLASQQPSLPVDVHKLLQAFRDGKKALTYGLLIHVKQPIPGKRRSFKWFDGVGHSFITLIKYNLDHSMVQRTFGYYPKRSFPLQGTPVLPIARSVFKNDTLHDFDETLGKSITAREFHKILRITRRFERKKYHLNKNNCTDFVLTIAAVAGFHIDQTHGWWPLGSGNDPGDTGQSILESKFSCACGQAYLRYDRPQRPKQHNQPPRTGGRLDWNSDSIVTQ